MAAERPLSRSQPVPEKPNVLVRIARWTVAAGLLVLLALWVDLGSAIRTVATANPWWMAVGLVIGLADRMFMILKWYPLVRVQIPTISLARLGRVYIASNFAGLFLPSSVGGDMVRLVALAGDEDEASRLGASIVAERLLGMMALGIVAPLSLGIAVANGLPVAFLLPWLVLALAFVLLVVLVPLMTPSTPGLRRWIQNRSSSRIVNFLRRFARAYAAYRSRLRLFLSVGLASVLEQGMPVLTLICVATSIDSSATPLMLLVAAPLTSMVSRLPISIAGIGVTEASMVQLLSLFGIPTAEALAIALLGRVISVGSVLPGAAFWLDLAGKGRLGRKSDKGRPNSSALRAGT